MADTGQTDLFKIWRSPMASASGPFGGVLADQLEKEDKANVTGEEKVPSKRTRQDLPIQKRFKTADEAMTWYNGWLLEIPPPDDQKNWHDKFKWQPVKKWFDKEGRGLYWYVTVEAGTPSLIIEGEATVIHWANQYYTYFVANDSQDAAELIWKDGGLPVEKPPRTMKPSTPEAMYHFEFIAPENLEKK